MADSHEISHPEVMAALVVAGRKTMPLTLVAAGQQGREIVAATELASQNNGVQLAAAVALVEPLLIQAQAIEALPQD